MPGIYLCISKLTFEPRETDNINKKIVYSMLESNKCSEEKYTEKENKMVWVEVCSLK